MNSINHMKTIVLKRIKFTTLRNIILQSDHFELELLYSALHIHNEMVTYNLNNAKNAITVHHAMISEKC